MGSGIGRNNTVRGDYDIQLFDPKMNRRLGLDKLRYGDFVAVVDADNRFGRSYCRGSAVSILWITAITHDSCRGNEL